jgi:hypothetical protein
MLATMLPSHASDLAVACDRCRVMLVTTLPSHAGDGAAEVT